jgi:RNA polymerase sigma-70 factor, ECF subfamily
VAPWNPSRASATDPVRDREALARQGYALHGAELYRSALSWLGDDATAQDAVQETIVRAWRAADRFDPSRGSLRTWLFAILRNVVRDQYSARQRLPVPLDPQRPGGATPMTDRPTLPRPGHAPDPSERVADTDLVTRALGQVSADHRTAIVETYLRDRTYDDVAAELGVSVSTLRSRVFHGLKNLRSAITTLEVER